MDCVQRVCKLPSKKSHCVGHSEAEEAVGKREVREAGVAFWWLGGRLYLIPLSVHQSCSQKPSGLGTK